MNNICYFEIQSSDPEREIKFYKNVFDWKFTREDSLPIEYYRIEEAGIEGGLLKRPAKVPSPGHGTNSYVCTIQVELYDQTESLILENGGQIAMAKFAIEGKCWQGYYMDADKNTFGIFQVDREAK